MTINRFANTPDKPFHSSGYAEAANKDSIGSTSPESFHQRYRVERNRQSVRSYRDSHIGRAYVPDAAMRRMNVDSPQLPGRQQRNVRPNTSGSDTIPPSRPSFTEPPKRPYNPFR